MTGTQTKEVQTAVPAQVLRRKLKDLGRKKRADKLKADAAFAKAYHEAKSKRALEKKSAFRKKKSRKK
ncbi:MAG: hypothetical protein ACO3A2_07380 [Bdellovibrionia bacterium]